MGKYIFACIALAFISAILYHVSHTALRESARLAMGVLLLSFAVAPIGALLPPAFDLEIPKVNFEGGAYIEVTEEAFCRGIAEALSDEYSVGSDCFIVVCQGFELEKMTAECVSVTLTGRAALLDYRAVREFVLSAVNIKECEVEVEIA